MTPEIRAEAVSFIEGKIASAEDTLKRRLEMRDVWRSGTNKSWQAVGCFLSKTQRLKDSEAHARIAEKNLQEVQMFKTVLEILNQTV